MDLDAARSVLGVSASDDWTTVRDAYRVLVRRSHPDLVGDSGVARTVEVNAAYRMLAVARREGRLHTTGSRSSTPGTGPRARPAGQKVDVVPGRPPTTVPVGDHIADDVRLLGTDTIVLSSPPEETFRRLVEGVHTLGEISYIDRGSAIFEAVLALADGHHASLVVSLQWRAHDATCEAFCTLEALDRAEHLDVSGVLEQLLPMIPPDRGSAPG
ncbi:J domain-containing protein [Actinospongicola halichondriae]|uniref:J domain-containing protein n=1 Tax=Actinospongicola halichondriae TaxID=3236844 RepID=UPI003D4D38CF